MDSELQQDAAIVSAPSRAARRAAVRLNGIPAADRRWVLARLAPAQRAAVEVALRQLEAITGSAQLDFGLFLEAGDASGLSAVEIDALPINRIPYEVVEKAVDALPPLYAANLVESGFWQESKRYLQQCAKRRRQAITAVGAARMTDAAALALADALARQLEAGS